MNETLSFLFDHDFLYAHPLERRVGQPTHPGLPRAFLVLAPKYNIPGNPLPLRPGQFRMVAHSRVGYSSYLYPKYLALYLEHDELSVNIC